VAFKESHKQQLMRGAEECNSNKQGRGTVAKLWPSGTLPLFFFVDARLIPGHTMPALLSV